MIGLYTKTIDGVWFGVASEEENLFATAFGFSEEAVLQSLLKGIPFGVPFQYSKSASAFAKRVVSSLKDIYDGRDASHGFSLVTRRLSDYARKVIETVSLIPLGYVASYGSVARVAGGSPRAVGRVMASHPFPPIVPCHRVVSSDLTLGGYGGGLDVKLAFLSRERRRYAAKREIPVNGKKLLVFPVEFVLKRLERGKC